MKPITCPHCRSPFRGTIIGGATKVSCSSCNQEIVLDAEGAISAATLISKTIEMEVPPPPKTDDPLVGKVIGGCKIVALLGKGAMGSVYKANQESLDRTVALKTIRPEFVTDEQFLSRFRQEAKTVGKFSTPYVVQIHEVGVADHIHYIIMEFVGGGSLWAYASKKPQRRLPFEDAIRFLGQAAEGLHEAEKMKIVHRDIKPENLLLDSKGRLKVADFGIAKALDANIELTMSAAIVGTPLYMSPEQGVGKSLDHRSDMYSLGASFYHLLTGVPPVQGDSVYDCIRKKTEMDCLSPNRIIFDQSIPGPLSSVIEKMTAREPENRYASFGDLVSDLQRVQQGLEPVAKLQSKKKPTAILAGAAALVLAGVGIWIWQSQGKPSDTGKRQEFASLPPPPSLKAETSDSNSNFTPPSKTPEKDEPKEIKKEPDPVKIEMPKPEEIKQAMKQGAKEAMSEAVKQDTSISLGPKFSAAELKGQIDTLRSQVASDTPSVLKSRGQDILSKISADLPEAKTLENEVKGIIADADQKNIVLQSLNSTAPAADAASIKELGSLWSRVQEILRPEKGSGKELGAWLAEQQVSRSTEFLSKAQSLIKTQFSSLDKDHSRFLKREVGAKDFQASVDAMEQVKKTFSDSFPNQKDSAEKWAPESSLASFHNSLVARDKQEQQIRAIASDVEGLKKAYAGVKQVSDWTGELPEKLRAQSETIRSSLDVVRKEDGSAPLEALDKDLKDCSSARETWSARAGMLQNIVASFESHRLAEVAAGMDKLDREAQSDPVFNKFQSARQSIEQGFKVLFQKLDLDAAQDQFSSAQKALKSYEAAARYPALCLERLEALRASIKDMARVSAAEVQLPKDNARPVEAFYLDRYECSIKAYRKFLQDSVKGKTFSQVKDFWPDEETFNKFKEEPAYLQENKNYDENFPIEDVNYFQAMAFLKANKKDLPTVEEWWLSAKGPSRGGTHYKFPWGEGSFESAQARDVNKSAERPARVDKDGISIGFRSPSVHHLAGNVAEWTKPRSEKAGKASLVGGRYQDTDEGYFSGAVRDELELTESGRGYGFRGVLRPKDYFNDLLPVGSP